MEITELTSTELARRLGAARPLLVDFIKAECPWCERLEPELTRIAEEWADTVDVVAVRVDNEPALVAEYGIRGTPALVLLHGDMRLGSKHGFQRAQQLRAFLSHHLGNPTA